MSNFRYRNKGWLETKYIKEGLSTPKIGVLCGVRGGVTLQADHVVPLSYLLREHDISSVAEARECAILWDIDNGRTLCVPCHRETYTFGSKALNYGK